MNFKELGICRAKMRMSGEWVYGFAYPMYKSLPPGSISPMWRIVEENDCHTDIEPSTICLFTGMKDKDGTRIFEGDIIKGNDGLIYDVDWLFPVAGFSLFCRYSHNTYYFADDSTDYQIIGNKFDNPELLGERARRNCK